MKNPFRNVRKYWRIKNKADIILDQIEEYDKMSKNIFKSRTFWFNILALVNELLKILPLNPDLVPTVPTETALPLVAAGNVVLRYLTTKPVTVLPEDSKRNW